MARYCKSCGSESKAQIPLFIVFIAAFIERSVFLSFYIAQTYIPTDKPDHFTPLRACVARGNNWSGSSSLIMGLPEKKCLTH